MSDEEDKKLEPTEQVRQTSSEKEGQELQQEIVAGATGAAAMADALNKPEVASICSLVAQLARAIPLFCWTCIVYVSLCKCFRRRSSSKST